MAAITKDERRVNRAQSLYDKGLDKYLDMIEKIDNDIETICDLLHGYALGRPEPEYQLSSAQYSALKDQLTTWKANVQNPEKILASINNGLKKKHGQQSSPENSSQSTPKIATFSPKAV